MEFNGLNEAIEYAKEHNQDVQKQDDKWVTIDKPVIPKEKQLADLELAIANEENEVIKAQLKEDWKRISGRKANADSATASHCTRFAELG